MIQNVPSLDLVEFVETKILPQYAAFDAAHNMEHVTRVIRHSMELVKVTGADVNMVYVIAAYHDLGMSGPRAVHHITGGKILATDARLKKWFSTEQLKVMREAVEDHRASAKQPPRTVYGAIVAEADRNLDTSTVIRRALLFGLKHNPELSDEEQCRRAAQHLQEKYSEEGYLHLWLNSERNVRQQQQLQSLISDPARLLDTTRQLLAEI